MTRLAGTEEWSQEAVFARIKFEQNVARGSVPVLMEMAAGHNYANPELVGQNIPSDAIFAEGRAAEIAFATDNFDLGVSICRRLVSNEQVGSRTPMQFVFKATVGALLGVRRVYLRSDGVTIKNADVDHSQFYAWNEIEPMQLETMIRHLIPPAAASGLLSETLLPLFFNGDEALINQNVLRSIFASLEYEIIATWTQPHGFQDRNSIRIFLALESAYASRLRLLTSDQFYWHTLRPRGSIIDWTLLSYWTAFYRLSRGIQLERRLPRPQTRQAEFIRALGFDLSRLAPFTSGDGDKPRQR